MKVMEDLNKELAAKMRMRTASKREVYIFMLELGRINGVDIANDNMALVHPVNLPIGYRFEEGDRVMPHPFAPEDKVLFVPYARRYR
jgi:hypothetical protein